MAAYAALVSLINNIEQIKIHPRVSTLFDEQQLESLVQRVESVLLFVERYNSYGGSNDKVEDLEKQITSVAHSAEDVIESHIVDHILPQAMIQTPVADEAVPDSNDVLIQSPTVVARSNVLDLEKIIQDMDSVREIVMKFELPAEPSTPAVSSRTGKSKMVGFDGYLTRLLSKLTGHQLHRQFIPIVGMGGLGKTTLARNAYDSKDVVHYFNVRAWVVISQTYILRDILSEIISCLGESKHEMDIKTEHELGEQLHKSLFGRRYLIVLDDMWDTKACDRIMLYLPDNSNGSRIIVTTRISDVANRFGSLVLELGMLDEDQSWELFCDKVFPQEVCPLELEESGKKIVKRCKGLPLSIVVIGGLLGSISRTQYQWESVEKDITSILNTTNDNQCLKLLSLSYSHLPAHLKPCFLYLGIFPEDDVIRVSTLVKLWAAEGFIKPNKDQSLEEIAENYIKDLVGRNLIFVQSLRRLSGKVKTFSMHDLVRDLCIRVAEKENFLCIASKLSTPREMDTQRRVIIRGFSGVENTLKSKSLPRSLIFNRIRKVHVKSRLLRVLVGVYSEPRDIIFQQVNMRFLAQEHYFLSTQVMHSWQLPSSISLLWNVQTLIINKIGVAKSEIWKMPQLRHLMFDLIYLPEPPPGDAIVLHNLHTLRRVATFMCTEEECKRMPNIKKLYVFNDDIPKNGSNFVLLSKLESLHYELLYNLEQDDLLQSFKFPNSLKKLTLEGFRLQWKDLTVIGSLPHLEALILKNSSAGPKWDPVSGEFLRLRYLQIEDSDLISWNADDTHFPVLENLVLENLTYLNEIPLGFGDIQTLERISLTYCTHSSALSAVIILEEQQSRGNERLQVKVCFETEREVGEFMERVEEEGLAGLNFQIDADL